MTSEQATHPQLTCADCRSVASKSINLVRDMLVQPDCAAIVKSVIALARDPVGVAVEGVAAGSWITCARPHCDEVQWLFDRATVQAKDVS
jgi:predicted signal transduction protein with EAL and GGDEF domain